jgi:hypothetical protein
MDVRTSTYRMDDTLRANARDLARELSWLGDVLDARLTAYFGGDNGAAPPAARHAPARREDPPPLGAGVYAEFVRAHALDASERLLLALALVPHVRPQLLDVLWARNDLTERGFSEFGGWHSISHGGFLPTGETAAFLLAGDDLAERFAVLRLFEGDHVFARLGVVHLAPAATSEPPLSGALVVGPDWLHRFTSGTERKPAFGSDFPARRIETRLTWDNLVLPEATLEQLEEIRQWLEHGDTLLRAWEMDRKLRPGFTALFHGPSGTGKTLSACLLGKHCGCDVYRIDLSLIVSKYIGETEKNLARVFDMAENRHWILFFDEADALFGRRTQVDNAHDRFANQEISYLLQRIEEHSGVVILASNLKGNIDDAFLRRFQSIVYFPMPRPVERRVIWERAFSPHAVLEPQIDLCRIAERYELSGGTIMNVVRYSSLKALSRHESTIWLEDMEEGIRREFLKEGRTA